MVKNEQVARLWSEGKVGRSKNMSTDGKTLWSYNMPIGVTLDDGRKVAIRYQAPRNYSNTTSRHVSYALQYADQVVDAPASGWIWDKDAAKVWVRIALEQGWTTHNSSDYAYRWVTEWEIIKKYGLYARSYGYSGAVYDLKPGFGGAHG